MLDKKENLNTIELELSIFRKANLLILFTACGLMLLDLFYFKDYPSVGVEATGTMIFAVFLFLSQSEELIPKLIIPFIISCFLIMNVGWYVGGGFSIGIALFYLLTIFVSLIIINKSNRKPLIAAIGMNLVFLMLIEFNNTRIREFQSGTPQELISSYIMSSITILLCTVLLYYVKNMYENAREQTFKLNKKLLTQASELKELNGQLTQMNENLESIAKEKTRQLEEQNRKLLDFAANNIKKVSVPVNEIVELTGVNHQKVKSNRSVEQIRLTAKELDLEVRELNLRLEKEEIS